MSGRKRHLVVDTLGLLLVVVVHAASEQDRDGAQLVFRRLQGRVHLLSLIWGDGGDAGQLIAWVRERFGWTLAIVVKPPDQQGFAVLPRRWVVERTRAWLGRHRRLSKDDEALPESSEAWITLALITVMLQRLYPRK